MMAAMLYRFAGSLNALAGGRLSVQLAYADAAQPAGWAADAAAYCQGAGIMTGRGGGNFVPQGTVTRADAAAMLPRFIEATIK